MRGCSAISLAVLGLTVFPVIASANGRAPITNGVFLKADDPRTALVRTTFGLLITQDQGCTFRWVCEKSIGYGGEFDPKYAIAADGTLFATTFTGLRVSRDGGCTWVTATAETPASDPGRVADIWIDALDIGPTGEVWVATAESARPNNIFRSTDNGVTFAPRNMASPTIWWKSIKVAHSDAQRIYVAGYQVAGTLPDGGQSPPTAHLLRSSDAGDTWTELPLASSPTMQFGSTPIVLVAAVDPKQPDTLLLTSLGANGAGDRLYRSVDAGATFEEVLATMTPIKDVVFTADGTVMVASAGGSSSSVDNGKTFTPLVGAPHLGCLAQRSDGQLVGCGPNWDPDFMAVAVASPAGTDWQKQFRFVELAGPLQCPAGTPSQQLCDPLWPVLQQQFGATGPTCGVTPEVDTTPMPKPGGGGCCDAGDASPLGAAAVAGFVGLGFVFGRRRRRAA
jgi:photosystem II stability/assembly factor-like uncharacterized protein